MTQEDIRKDMIAFANWYRSEDTQENAEKYFHWSDEDFLNLWLEQNNKII